MALFATCHSLSTFLAILHPNVTSQFLHRNLSIFFQIMLSAQWHEHLHIFLPPATVVFTPTWGTHTLSFNQIFQGDLTSSDIQILPKQSNLSVDDFLA